MPVCVIGRAIAHDDPDLYPGFQEPCPKPVSATVYIAQGTTIDGYEVCADHLRAFARFDLIGDRDTLPEVKRG